MNSKSISIGEAVILPPGHGSHISHMARAAFLLAFVVFTIFMANRQWLRDNTLRNSPGFDALVYQNQSYDDYILVRKEGPFALYKKYTDGRWHVPPLYMMSGTLTYLLFGRDPANFYIPPAVWFYLMILSVYGYLHYWTGRWLWAAAGALLLLTTPSVVTFGLRVSQTDFSVGAAFTLSTYILIASGGLLTWRGALLYAASAGVCALLKSSIVPYFLAHVAIGAVYLWADPERRWTRLKNAALATVAIFAFTGWFYFNNMRQIISYYTEWGGKMSAVTQKYAGIETWVDHVLFYLRSFASFHLHQQHWKLYALIAIASAVLWAVAVVLRKKREVPAVAVLITTLWIAIPYAILTMYQSKAYSVDFPFIAVFYILPLLFAASVFRGRAASMAAVLILFAPLILFQSASQARALLVDERTADWRELEVLGDMLKDAERRGLAAVYVSNAFIHRYLTSENLRFFVVNGTFRNWQDKYKVLPLRYFDDAESYYKFLLDADYVLAKTGGYEPPLHPDNVLAPRVNEMLASSSVFAKFKKYPLPDGSDLIVYRNEKKSWIDHPEPLADGWIPPRFPVTLYGERDTWRLRLTGAIPLPESGMYPASVYLEDESGERVVKAGEVYDGARFEMVFTIPESVFTGRSGAVTLYLTSDRAYRPIDFGLSSDARELLMLFYKLTIVETPS